MSFNSSDNTVVSSAVNISIAQRIFEVADDAQTGFIRGWNFLGKRLLDDCFAKATFSADVLSPLASRRTIAKKTLSFDNHDCLLERPLDISTYPCFCILIVKFFRLFVVARTGPAFTVISGVLQGCPMSASLLLLPSSRISLWWPLVLCLRNVSGLAPETC